MSDPHGIKTMEAHYIENKGEKNLGVINNTTNPELPNPLGENIGTSQAFHCCHTYQ